MSEQTRNSSEHLASLGKQAFADQDYTGAAEFFHQALQACNASGDLLAAAEMRNNLCVALLKAGDAQGAWDAVYGTEDIFAAAGDTRREAMAIGNQAAVLEAQHKFAEAEAAYTRCNELLRKVGEHGTRADVLESLSQLQMRMGKRLEALATMQSALENKPKLSLRQKLLKALLGVPFKLLNRGG